VTKEKRDTLLRPTVEREYFESLTEREHSDERESMSLQRVFPMNILGDFIQSESDQLLKLRFAVFAHSRTFVIKCSRCSFRGVPSGISEALQVGGS